MEALGLNLRKEGELKKNSVFWKLKIRKKKKATEKIMYSSAKEGDISLL